MPLRTSFIGVASLSRLTNSHVGGPTSGAGGAGFRSAIIGLRLLSLKPFGWHDAHGSVSRRRARVPVSRLLPPSRSTVKTSAGQPAASARLIICRVWFQSLRGYSWNHTGSPRAAVTSSMDVVAGVASMKTCLPGLRRARHRQFAVGVEGPVAANRAQEDRRCPTRRRAADTDVSIVPMSTSRRTRSSIAREPLPVRPHRRVIVGARLEVAEVGRRQVLSRDRLEVEDVERVLGGR